MAKPNIEYLVFSGGGAKGVLYPGVYKALKESGIFDGVNMLSGSSVGALLASLMAFGISEQKLIALSQQANFIDLLGNRTPYALIERDGQALYEFMVNNIKSSIVAYFDQNNTLNKSNEIKEIIAKCASDKPITFADLLKLNRYDSKTFKLLVVTAVEKKTGDFQVFNAEVTPEVDVALACKASAALPIILQSTKIDVGGQIVEYIDGGYFDNMPTEDFIMPVFDNNEAQTAKQYAAYTRRLEDTRAKTLVFGFSQDKAGDNLYKALKTQDLPIVDVSWLKRFVLYIVIHIFAGIHSIYSYLNRKESVFRRLREYYRDKTVTLKPKAVSTISFTEAKKQAKKMIFEGYFSTYDFLHDKYQKELPQLYVWQKFYFRCFKAYQKDSTFMSPYTTDLVTSWKAQALANFFVQELKTTHIADYIHLCCYDRATGKPKSTTRAVRSLIKTLNRCDDNTITSRFRHILSVANNADFTHNDIEKYINLELANTIPSLPDSI
ncbi:MULTISPECIES: patatin-like phospholipase family protein [Cysteiniphilum]|uniref:Esterase n=1 Tax=Cysteiniphilum litorale TaxID=2056700 RepID=A0A8J2Z3F2_9GAMM|nr:MULTISPECIES: patatin-like phospholipase family protein [Cysteiniphilum]GGF93478.1 esterase [Cysteiniphilum litorale]